MLYFPLWSKRLLLCKIYPGQLIDQAENHCTSFAKRGFGSSGLQRELLPHAEPAGPSPPKVIQQHCPRMSQQQGKSNPVKTNMAVYPPKDNTHHT